MPDSGLQKICQKCGINCAGKPRTKDSRGRYFCQSCYNAAAKAAPVSKPKPSSPQVDSLYELEPIARSATGVENSHSSALSPPEESLTCPSCQTQLQPGAIVCISCGVHVKSGRSITTAEQGDTDSMYSKARRIIWFASWPIPLGLYPIASEAHGSRKPLAIPAIAILTILITTWFWGFEWSGSPKMRELKNLYLWAGDAPPDAEYIASFYAFTNFGDRTAWEWKVRQLSYSVPEEDLPLAALNALPSEKRCFGEFHFWQLLTHTFLHGDVFHLVGNMLFLLLFGSRINALIGNVGVMLLYPILAAAASFPQMLAVTDEMPHPNLGASGAIMGLAGMYFILFPVSKLHVAAWIRIPILLLKLFRCRGFWILLFFMAFDIMNTAIGSDDGVAHWAHLGGFIAGMLIAIGLILARAVNTRGNDIFSVLLGRNAWNILGKPSQWHTPGREEGWLTRLHIIPEEIWQRGMDAAFGNAKAARRIPAGR